MYGARHLLLAALLTVLTVFVLGREADAGMPAFTSYYVDPAVGCAGMTPCFDSIQEAVDHASGPGGSQIVVFPGTYLQDVDLTFMGSSVSGAVGEIKLIAADAAGQPATGTVTLHGGTPLRGVGFGAPVTIDGFVFEATTGDGVLLSTDGAITIRNSTANAPGDGADSGDGTGDDGFDLSTTAPEASVTIESSAASNNTGIYGDGFEVKSAGGVTVTDSTANNNVGANDNDGFDVYDTVGHVTVDGVTASGNSEQGIAVDTQGDIEVTQSDASGNGTDGLTLATNGSVDVSDTTASNNEGRGLSVSAAATATVTGSDLSTNMDDGAGITASVVEVTNTIASGNAEDGLRIISGASVSIDRATLNDNGFSLPGQRDGAYITPANGAITSFSVTNTLAAGNFASGIKVDDLAAASHVLRGNVFCNHVEEGFGLFSAGASVDAEGNWWGVASGPLHPGNPGGTGDVLIDGANGGAGSADYDPWISTVNAALDGDAFAGQAVGGSATFESTGGARTLMEGPGAGLGTPPFTVTSPNGSVSTSGFISGGQLDFTWTPTDTGPSSLAVAGPCGLSATIQADVQQGGEAAIWGDNNCSQGADPVDSLLTLRYDAGLPASTCFTMGTTYEIAGASPHPWGDVDCGGDVTPVDSLKVLRFDAGLSVAQAADCPAIGSDVLVSELPAP